jgi:hypothetical protein
MSRGFHRPPALSAILPRWRVTSSCPYHLDANRGLSYDRPLSRFEYSDWVCSGYGLNRRISGFVRKKILGSVPESSSSSRNTYAEPASPRPAHGGNAELRLAVLWSLPTRHQTYLFEEVRKLCVGYLRGHRISAEEVSPLELVSEVWKKLLGSVSLETDRLPVVRAGEWSTDPNAPECDGRVIWLIAEIGGSEAIGHRYEDIQRERHGRPKPGRGRPNRQLGDADESEETGVEPGEPGELQNTDSRRIWRGLLATAAVDFRPDDDVSTLLRLMAEDPGILDDSLGGKWPVSLIVARLNARPTSRRWSEDRINNAKSVAFAASWCAGNMAAICHSMS